MLKFLESELQIYEFFTRNQNMTQETDAFPLKLAVFVSIDG